MPQLFATGPSAVSIEGSPSSTRTSYQLAEGTAFQDKVREVSLDEWQAPPLGVRPVGDDRVRHGVGVGVGQAGLFLTQVP